MSGIVQLSMCSKQLVAFQNPPSYPNRGRPNRTIRQTLKQVNHEIFSRDVFRHLLARFGSWICG